TKPCNVESSRSSRRLAASLTITLPLGSWRASVADPTSSLLVARVAPSGRGLIDCCASAPVDPSARRPITVRRFISVLGGTLPADDHSFAAARHDSKADVRAAHRHHGRAEIAGGAGANRREIPRVEVWPDVAELPHLRGREQRLHGRGELDEHVDGCLAP